MKISNVLFVGAGLLIATPAFAQGDGSGSATVGAGAEVGVGGASAGAGAEVTVPTGDTMGVWPLEMISRPWTLPASKLSVYGDFDVARFSLGAAGSVTGEGLHLGLGYGVNDKITVGADYSFSLHEFEIKGPLALYGEFSLAHTSKLSVAASADLTINLNATTFSATGMPSSGTTETLHAGLGARYTLAPKIAVYTSGGSIGLASGLDHGPVGPGPVGQHLAIGFQSGAPITFAVPVGIALQATPQILAFASTTLASFSISNSANAFIGKDFFQLNLGAYFTASKMLDVGAFLSLPDLKGPGFDLMFFGLGARWYN